MQDVAVRGPRLRGRHEVSTGRPTGWWAADSPSEHGVQAIADGELNLRLEK
jgi:hypothetical protein